MISSVELNFFEFDPRAEKTENVPEVIKAAVQLLCNVQREQKSGDVARILFKEKDQLLSFMSVFISIFTGESFGDATDDLMEDFLQCLLFNESWLWNAGEGI